MGENSRNVLISGVSRPASRGAGVSRYPRPTGIKLPLRPPPVGRFARGGRHMGPNGKPLVRLRYGGRTRRVALLRVAWIVATGEHPKGAVRPRDGDEWNASEGNLILVRRGHNPFSSGTSSLERRAEADRAMLEALAANPGASIAQLSRSVGSSKPCVCVRFARLEASALACGPHCDHRKRWDLSAQGREAAAAANPLVLDDLDKRILTALVSPMRLMALARRIEICRLTARRRIDRLVERGLAATLDSKFMATPQGRSLLGDAAPEPWVKREAVAASMARDVLERRSDDRTYQQIRENGRMAKLKAIGGARDRLQRSWLSQLVEPNDPVLDQLVGAANAGLARHRRLLFSARRQKRQPGQRGQRLRPSSLHDRGAVVLDRALADVEIGCDVLAGLAGEHPFHHLVLSRRKTREVSRRRFSHLLQLVRILRQFESLPDEACGFAGIKGLQKGLAACIGVDDAAARR